jgi:CPA2 family monovalent cation:H+ antiporter-2
MLAPGQLFLVLLAAGAAAVILLWRPGRRLFERARRSLEAGLREAAPATDEAPMTLSGRLGEARLESFTIPPDAAAVGQRIRELRIRSLTGASVVGIERDGESLINPGPEEEFRAGDRVLILGEPLHCERARALLGRARMPPRRAPSGRPR